MKIFFLAIIPMLVITTTANVYASGPRLDAPDDATREGFNCWVDGYDAGFAQKYDKDRADECKESGENNYNGSWKYGCIDSGLTKTDCEQIKDNPEDLEHESLQEENRRQCYDDGFEDGQSNNSFDKDRDKGCSEYGNSYENGFSAGCQSLGNTNDRCELTIKGHASYCPWRPDDPACTEFLHDVSNKLPRSSIGACAQVPYHPGCPQNYDPERYCLVTDDPAFCRTVGDLCDPDGFVKPEDAYCDE
jgi:hypothetical protein